MKPRARFRLLYWFPLVFAVVSGYVADRRATALRVADVDKRLDEISMRLDDLKASMKKSSAVERLSAEGNEPQRGESVEGYRPTPVVRPRFLGRGKTGSWIYLDVRHVDGQVCRYYIRRDPTREQVREFVATLVADCGDRSASLGAEN